MNIKVKHVEVTQLYKMDHSKLLDEESLEQIIYISKKYKVSRREAMKYVIAINHI